MTNFRTHLHATCMDHAIPADRIMSTCRRARVARARQDLMHRLRLDGWPLEAIGSQLDRDHTTVAAGIRAHENREQARAAWQG